MSASGAPRSTHQDNGREERLLIVNADDLGLAPGVTRGILELARQGIVTSTSVMVNMPGALEALAAAREAGLDVGLHLNICAGAPLSPPERVRSLLDREGRFETAGELSLRFFTGRLRLDEVEREWTAQIKRFLAAGVRPSHLDSHNHLHAYQGLYGLAARLARHYGVPGLRRAYAGYIFQSPRIHALTRVVGRRRRAFPGIYQPEHFSVLTVLGRLHSPRALLALLRALPPGATELVCHPGHVDDTLRRLDPLTDARERELLLLSRPLVRETLAREGIRLVSWADASLC